MSTLRPISEASASFQRDNAAFLSRMAARGACLSCLGFGEYPARS